MARRKQLAVIGAKPASGALAEAETPEAEEIRTAAETVSRRIDGADLSQQALVGAAQDLDDIEQRLGAIFDGLPDEDQEVRTARATLVAMREHLNMVLRCEGDLSLEQQRLHLNHALFRAAVLLELLD